MLHKYEVTIRNRPTGNRWSLMFWADNFADAERQAKTFTDEQKDEEIIEISKDYDAAYDVEGEDLEQ